MFEFRRAKPHLGTIVEVSVGGVKSERAMDLLDRAFLLVSSLESKLSRHISSSDIARINSADARSFVPVSGETISLLRLAKELHRSSRSLFDICLPVMSKGTFSSLALSDSGVFLKDSVTLDVGGIGKGFIVDRVFEYIASFDLPSILVNAGGDLRISSTRMEPLLVKHPASGTLIKIASGRAYACATSSDYYRDFPLSQSGLYHPILGPIGYEKKSISIISPSCAVSDALTKIAALDSNIARLNYSLWKAHEVVLQ